MPHELLIILGLTLLNGVFAGAEIAVLSLRTTRLAELIEDRARGARAVQWLREQPERFLATVQVGITVVGTTAAAFGGERLAGTFGRWLAAHAPWLGPQADRLGLVSVVALISFLGIVVGELVPKSLALRFAEQYSLTMGSPLRWMARLASPVVWVLAGASNLVLRVFGIQTSFSESRLSPDELREQVEEAARAGTIDAKSSEIASRAIDFRALTVRDVMVPRLGVIALDRKATPAELQEKLAWRSVTRLPVYEDTPENIVGYVTVKDLIRPALRGSVDIGSLVRPVRFVPTSLRAADLLRDMQSQRAPLVMAVDESGGVVGLVTLEDLLEELVGEMFSENDPPPASFSVDPDGSVILPGTMPVRDINRALHLELPEHEHVVTIAGLCLKAAQAIPVAGTTLTLDDGSRVDILDATARRIRTVRLWPASPEPPTSGSA